MKFDYDCEECQLVEIPKKKLQILENSVTNLKEENRKMKDKIAVMTALLNSDTIQEFNTEIKNIEKKFDN